MRLPCKTKFRRTPRNGKNRIRDESYLYRGARLATAREKLDQNKLVLSGLAQEFVETAITARETARQREQARTRRLLIGFGAAALVFAVLAILSIFLWRNGVVSEQRAQAESTRGSSKSNWQTQGRRRQLRRRAPRKRNVKPLKMRKLRH